MDTERPRDPQAALKALQAAAAGTSRAMAHAQRLEENLGLCAHKRLNDLAAGMPGAALKAAIGSDTDEEAHDAQLAERARLMRLTALQAGGHTVAGRPVDVDGEG